MDYARKIAFDHNGPPNRTELKQIDRFGDKNRVNSNNLNTTILKFSEKFVHSFSHVYLFCNRFPQSHGLVAMLVTSCIKDTCSNVSQSNLWRETKCFNLVTGTETKQWLSGKMLPNINTCENEWSNFSENLRIVALKLLELIRFLSPIY